VKFYGYIVPRHWRLYFLAVSAKEWAVAFGPFRLIRTPRRSDAK